MTKRYLDIGGIIGATLTICVMCDIFLRENIPFLSIGVTQDMISHWATHWHILVVALLPFYMAVIFFGASIIGFFIGSTAQHRLMLFCDKK